MLQKSFAVGVHTVLWLLLALAYICFGFFPALQEVGIELFGFGPHFFFPAILIFSLKIGFDYANKFALWLIVTGGLLIQALLSAIFAMFALRNNLHNLQLPITFEDAFGSIGVKEAGGLVGRLGGQYFMQTVHHYVFGGGLETADILLACIAVGAVGILGIFLVALWFMPEGRKADIGGRRFGVGRGGVMKYGNISFK
jgi:hypothetical protein